MSWESQGAKSRLAVSTNASMSNANSVWLEFTSESLQLNEQILNPTGQRGTRSQASERNVRGPRAPSGNITLPLSQVALDNLLPAILGAAESSDTFDVAETLPALYAMIEKLTDVELVSKLYVEKATFSGSSGGLCTLAIDVEAEDMTGGQTFPTATTTFRPEYGQPFQLADTSAITLNSVARNFFSFSIEVTNQLTKGDFTQGLTRSGTISPEDRIVVASFDLPAITANADLQSTSRPVTGQSVDLVLANAAGDDVTFKLGRFAWLRTFPTIDGKGRKVIRVSGPVRAEGHPGVTGFVPDIQILNVAA
jgi:hypothetical protein